MRSYGELLRIPGVARILLAQLAARFPGGMLSLGLLIHIEGIFGSYAAAGLVLAALSVGQAIAGPLTGRWMGVWGMRPVLILTSAVCAVTLVVVAVGTGLPLTAFVALAFLVGLSLPPIQPAVRTIYPKLVNGRQLTPLFSLDATAQEIIWIAGPVVVTFVATQVSSILGVLLSAFFVVAGGAWFISSPELGRVRIPRSKRRFGKVLTRPSIVVTTVVGLLLIGSFAATEAGVVATFGDGSPDSGIVLAIWSVASLLGGLAFGHRTVRPWTLAVRLVVIFAGVLLASLTWDFWSLTGALVIAGLFIAPALAVMSQVVSVSVRFSDTAEAYGWVGTGQLIGVGMGSAVAGFLIDGVGAHGGFWAATAFAGAATIVSALFFRSFPDLKGRDASPIPDTEPVPVQPS